MTDAHSGASVGPTEASVYDDAFCPWCSEPVDYAGETCDINCYWMWVRFHQEIVSRPKLIAVQDWEEIPLDIEEQPWYDEEMRKA